MYILIQYLSTPIGRGTKRQNRTKQRERKIGEERREKNKRIIIKDIIIRVRIIK